MDLHFHGPEPTAAEQAAVDSVLGPPASAWAGGPRNVEEEGHSSLLGGHAARSRRDLLLPALHAVQSRFRLGAPGCPRLYLQAPDRAPRRGARRRHVLSPLLARAAPPGRRPRLRRHRLSDQGGGASVRRAGAFARAGERRLLETKPVPGSLRTAPAALVLKAGESPSAISLAPATTADIVAARGSDGGSDSRRFRITSSIRTTVRRPDAPPARENRPDRPREPRGLSGLGRVRRAGSGDRIRPGGRHSRGPGLQAHGPRRGGVSDGPQVGRRGEGSCHGPTTWSAMPTSRSPARSRTAS